MKILPQLRKQVEDIQAGSTGNISIDFGHAIGVIAQKGVEEAEMGGDKDAQIKKMRQKAAEEIVRFGPKILDYLRPELRVLIQPKDIPELEKEHQMYLSARKQER